MITRFENYSSDESSSDSTSSDSTSSSGSYGVRDTWSDVSSGADETTGEVNTTIAPDDGGSDPNAAASSNPQDEPVQPATTQVDGDPIDDPRFSTTTSSGGSSGSSSSNQEEPPWGLLALGGLAVAAVAFGGGGS